MDEPESLFNEQSTVASPALGTNFMKVIQLAMGRTPSEAEGQAWDVLCGAWVRDETQSIVKVLGEAQVNIQAFLVNFLKRIWIKYLGDNTSVLGAYESSRLTEEAEKKTPPRLIHTLLNSGRYGRPELKPEGAVQANWPHVFRPPQVPKWSEIAIPNHPDERLSQALATLVADMKRQSKGMDWVIAHAIALSPDGLTGIGRSAEARAYTFCYLSRIYRPSSGVLQFTPSPQVLQLQDDLRAPNAGYITLNVLVAQMLPILENMTPETFKGRAEYIDVSAGSADDRPFTQWDALSPLPLWLFAIHLKFRMSDDFFACSLARDWAKDGSDSFVVLRRMDGQEPRRIPVLSLVAWILLGRLPERIEDGNPQKRRIGEDVYRPELECILQARLADVDALLLDNPNLLGDSWRGARPAFIKTFLDIVIESNPSKYQQCARGVMRLVIELLNATGAERYDTRVTTIAELFLRFIALCGTYTQAFVEAMTEANRTTAFVIFSHMLKLLNPLPGTNEFADLAKVQKTYERAAYEDPQDLPPHLTDRFVGVVLEIARHQTPVAQGLADAGILQLLDAIRGGRYTYPEVPDLVPPEVRKMLRERMCEETLKALSERVYLAAQLKRVYVAAEAHEDDDAAPRTPPPRIRPRPSWMATGG